jgi:hypothetical protein
LSSASGSYEISGKYLGQQTLHQLTLVPAAGASGSVAVKFRPRGTAAGVVEALLLADEVTARTMDLAGPSSIRFEVAMAALILDCSAVTGTFDALLESR